MAVERRASSCAFLTAALLVAAAGCELEEISVVQVEEVVVAEVYANVAEESADNEIFAFLHKTVAAGDVDDVDAAEAELEASRVMVRLPDGTSMSLVGAGATQCIEDEPEGLPVACFTADSADAARVASGDLLEVEVELFGGSVLEGAARVPGDFELLGVPSTCTLPPDERLAMEWTRADGAWAYVNETAISGLPEALEPEGIIVEEDPLYLLGLSISDSDTTIVFPSEFGVFNRLDLDRDLAVRLQTGLPEGVLAEVTVTAVDRNYVNWARGGSFNPSGQVRVPSLRGDGTGVFGATVNRRIVVSVSAEPLESVPLCDPDLEG